MSGIFRYTYAECLNKRNMPTKTKEQLDTNQGKEALKLEILETINNELVKLGAKPEIKTVQLTKLLLI